MKSINNLHKLSEIKAPQELKERTLQTILAQQTVKKKKRKAIPIAMAGAAAAFVLAVNVSPAMAIGLRDIPVIGALVRVISLQSKVYQNEVSTVTVETPAVEGQDKINARIQEQVQAYEAKAQKELEEYKKAFLATGGTEEAFKQKNIQVKVDYQVKSQTEDMVSFVLTGSQDWNAGTVERYYYNLRLSDGSEITLKDLLGDDWVAKVNGQIVSQIEAHNREQELDYYIPESENGFRTVDENTNFYIDADGNPVVVFEKYEIGPGVLGEPSFVIRK